MADMLKQKGIRTSVVTTASYYKTYESLAETADGDMFLMTGDFCDEMFGFICYGTPKMNVVIADNIVSGYFKEPLVKGGDCDTDGDTLSDSEEVDWDNVKEVHEDGTYELYTWKELCQKSRLWFLEVEDYAGGESNPLFELMGDIEVIPATSNPFSADTDKDYYPDNRDEDILDTNPMYIYDAGINDSGFHKGVSVAVKESDKFTDGKLTVNNSESTAKYSFTRRPGDFAYFTLKPDAISYYKFTNKANAAASVTVSYEKGWGLWAETVYVDPESNGTYLLERGKEYTIEIYGDGYSNYEFTAEQDNWVYAPDGGVWEANDGESLSEYKPIKQYYITPKLFVDSLYTNIDNDFEITTIYTQKDLENVMKSLEPELRSQLRGEINTFLTAGGVVVLIIDVFSHEKYKILKVLGNVITVSSGGTLGSEWIENFYIDHIEDVLKEGNLHICYSTYMTKFYNNYNPWTTERYIPKIQFDIAGSVIDSLSYKTVQDACGFPNFDN